MQTLVYRTMGNMGSDGRNRHLLLIDPWSSRRPGDVFQIPPGSQRSEQSNCGSEQSALDIWTQKNQISEIQARSSRVLEPKPLTVPAVPILQLSTYKKNEVSWNSTTSSKAKWSKVSCFLERRRDLYLIYANR